MILSVNKPTGISSYDVIRQIKRVVRGQKIGHGGTLDPLASGVLIIAVGKTFTKQLATVLHDTKKTYVAEIRLDGISETDDREGPITPVEGVHIPTLENMRSVLPQFTGEILQTPPLYSAMKIGGKRAYALARKGKEVPLEPRPVSIYQLNILSYDFPIVKIEIECGSGTYIRSLARDIGKTLQTGGYLFSLERTKVGQFSIEKSLSIEEAIEVSEKEFQQ